MSLETDIDRLARVPILSAMNHEALRLLAFAAESCSFDADDVIFTEDEAAECGFLITSGTVTISAATARTDGPRTLGPGALLGEQAMLAATRRPVTARAETAVSAVKISRTLLARVLQEYPANAVAIRRRWARRLGARMASAD